MAYLSHTGTSFAARKGAVARWNWRLIFVLAFNTLGWLLIGALIAQAL